MASVLHHLYVETREWEKSLRFWEALGFHLDEGWGEQRDCILSQADGEGPYIFLRLVRDDRAPLAFGVVFGATNIDTIASAEAVLVDRERYSSGWGPDLLDVKDPDGRILTIRAVADRPARDSD